MLAIVTLTVLVWRDHASRSPSLNAFGVADPAAAPKHPTAKLTPGTRGAAFAAVFPDASAREAALLRTNVFHDWLLSWRRADPSAQTQLALQGRELAQARRDALAYLIQTDPKLALSLAVHPGVRHELPSDVQDLLEDQIDTRGSLDVRIRCFDDTVGHVDEVERVASADAQRWHAHVYGRREMQTSQRNLPLHGIAIGTELALSEQPYRVIESAEPGYTPQRDEFPVRVGKEIMRLGSRAALDQLRDSLLSGETPTEGSDVPVNTTNVPVGWNAGVKRVLFVRADFSDIAGSGITDPEITTAVTAANSFYDTATQGQVSFTTTILPGVFHLAHTAAYYADTPFAMDDMGTDITKRAHDYDLANGGTGLYDPDRADRWVIIFPHIPATGFAGIGNIGEKGLWLNGSSDSSVFAHELGHNAGLYHSHAWKITSGSPFATTGEHVEYGDVFDIMGDSREMGSNTFNVAQKQSLGFLPTDAVTSITQNGTYRIYRHDHRNASGVRALKLPSVTYDYWLEYRRVAPPTLSAAQASSLQNSVQVHWANRPYFTSGNGPYLLDMNPDAQGDMNDASLAIGKVYSDTEAGIAITPLSIGGTAPNEYIDVKLEFGATGSNHNPTIAATAPAATVTARTDVNVAATATDPDGDTVQYRWDFGDRRENPTTASQTHRWLKGGSYNVNVTAIDGKGGRNVTSYPITVTDPFLTWTRRAQDVVTAQVYLTATYGGGKFVFAGSNGLISASTDGISWTSVTSPAPTFTARGLAYNGTRYVAVGDNGTTPITLSSTDGLIWQMASLPAGAPTLYGVAASSTRFVAVGQNGKIYTSTDGQSWTDTPSSLTDRFYTVTYADGKFVIGGDNGRILTSTDGLSWTNRSLPKPHPLLVVARAGNLWYATPGTYVWTSPDAVTWTEQRNTPNTSAMAAATTPDGTMLITTSIGEMAWTEGLLRWESTAIDPKKPYPLSAFAVGNGLVVTGGFDGAIYTAGTPTVAAPQLRDLRAAPEVQAGRDNSVAISGQNFTKLELLVNNQVVTSNDGSSALTWAPSRFGSYQVSARGTLTGGTTATSTAQTVNAIYSDWSWSSPLPFATSLSAGVRVNDRWYLVGGAGGIYSIDDAGNATRVNFRSNEHFTGIGYANGRFVVSSGGNDLARSKSSYGLWSSLDGTTWTPWQDGFGVGMTGVTYGPGLWVAVGSQILTSTNGVDWVRRASSVLTSAILSDVAYGGGQWVAVGSGGAVYTSPDGITWTSRTSGSSQSLNHLAYYNGHWVAAGQGTEVLHSTDAITWTHVASTTNSNEEFSGVTRGRDGFVLVSRNGSVLVSTTGLTWTAATKPSGNYTFSGVATDGTNTLLLGTYGSYLTSSSAPNTWTRPSNLSTTPEGRQVVYGNNKFVAVGYSTAAETNAPASAIRVSADGNNWTDVFPAGSGPSELYAVSWNGQQFVTGGGFGVIYTSPDGTTWTSRTGTSTGLIRGIASTATSYVAVGFGVLESSLDGITWTNRAGNSPSNLISVAYGSNGYVAVGNGGVIMTSPDGVTWTTRTSGTTSDFYTVTAVSGVGYMAGGFNGLFLVSTDGATWTPRNIGAGFDNINSITETPQGVMINAGYNGAALFSGDGITWVRGALPTDRAVNSFAVGSTMIVGVGQNGLFLTQPRTQGLIATTPTARAIGAGGTTTFNAGPVAVADASYQWQRNGANIANAINANLTLGNLQPGDTGVYSALTTSGSLSSTTTPAILGLTTTAKVVGTGSEVGTDIKHQNGNIFDQILLEGAAATFTADSALNQITRLSYIDLTNDIVQVEFSGAGSVSIVLEGASGPALPLNYNQGTSYMKGHAGIVVTGANETTNLSVFSVGRGTAVNQALFKDSVTYDGLADIAFIAIQSTNGKFGGLRTSDTSYWATKGITGIYAPGVAFQGPVFVGDISAQNNATPYLVIGSGNDVRITGGDMQQANNKAIVVSGVVQLKFTAGTTSHYIDASTPTQFLLAKTNQGRFEQNGTDVTAQIVVNP
jgi:hypothetical protein